MRVKKTTKIFEQTKNPSDVRYKVSKVQRVQKASRVGRAKRALLTQVPECQLQEKTRSPELHLPPSPSPQAPTPHSRPPAPQLTPTTKTCSALPFTYKRLA